MRSYDVGVVSLAIDAPKKWTDNLLAQHHVPNVQSKERGVSRRIPFSALLHIAVTRALHVDLGIGVRDALALAEELLAETDTQDVERGPLRVTLDRALIEGTLNARLAEVLESAPSPARGRPVRR